LNKATSYGKKGGAGGPPAGSSKKKVPGRGGYGREGHRREKSPARGGGSATDGKPADEAVRLNKFIAASGVCSRREADQLITAGVITVNGKTITELGTKVKPGDDVRFNGKRISSERKVYLLLNKPKDYVTTTDDPKERKTVMLLIRNACSERIYPVGRLDRQTTGVLLFTNDGEMAKRLTHPGYNKKKIYHIFLDKGISAGDLQKLADGITLEDGFIQPDAISYVTPENRREIGLEIHSGRNRIVRRMFEHLGYRVTKLDRVYFAGLTKKNLPRGKWRFLTEKEVNRLKMNAYE
jgi:23S rRNA pseudouridine2605 synthase